MSTAETTHDALVEELRANVEEFNASEGNPADRVRLIRRIRELRAQLATADNGISRPPTDHAIERSGAVPPSAGMRGPSALHGRCSSAAGPAEAAASSMSGRDSSPH